MPDHAEGKHLAPGRARLSRPFWRWLLWHTARFDNSETLAWNWLNHRYLGGMKP